VRLEEETILFPMPTSPRCLRDHCRSQGLEPSPVGLILNSSAVIAAERQGALSGKSRSRHKPRTARSTSPSPMVPRGLHRSTLPRSPISLPECGTQP
jgi:hypothetical protein